jgi:ferritin-like metal-binding protein YciE
MMSQTFHPAGKAPFSSTLAQLIGAEQQASSLISKMIEAVWSVELRRTLRSALAMSHEHQQRLLSNCDFSEPKKSGDSLEQLGDEIRAVISSQERGSSKDLSLTRLAIKMIRYKMRRYEKALKDQCINTLKDSRMLGSALSDETAASLFLREHAERFLDR